MLIIQGLISWECKCCYILKKKIQISDLKQDNSVGWNLKVMTDSFQKSHLHLVLMNLMMDPFYYIFLHL